MIQKILIANRGEIAARVIRTAKRLGFETVAVYSNADQDAPHVYAADEAICIGGTAPNESYLQADKLIAAAQQTGAQAIHPGYGFLSENAAFAEQVEKAELCWIGPPAAAIQAMGDKGAAKAIMMDAGVPLAKGYQGPQTEELLLSAAEDIGYPLLIKATAGGGGRGIRIVRHRDEFLPALRIARSEAENAFACADVILEQYIENARHIEIQVFADTHGNAVHLFERDCSVQRRRQKIIEEAPSPALSPEVRQQMGEAAVLAAKAVDYVGAGTVEFLLDEKGFYFMEMNTRLQVEHPVTEEITGLDLVEWQLRVAIGEKLPLLQKDISFAGHAIEVRIYAEDAANGFLPCTGQVLRWKPPHAEQARCDHGVSDGQEITPYYDPMLAKLIVKAENRNAAIRKLCRALKDMVLLGPTHNRHFLLQVLRDPVFVAGQASTTFVEEVFLPSEPSLVVEPTVYHWLAAAWLLGQPTAESWNSRGCLQWQHQLQWGETTAVISIQKQRDQQTMVLQRSSKSTKPTEQSHSVTVLQQDEDKLRMVVDDHQVSIYYARQQRDVYVQFNGHEVRLQQPDPLRREDESAGSGHLYAPITGKVVAVHATLGQELKQGDCVVVVESMKTEYSICAQIDGQLAELRAVVGQQVKTRQLLGQISGEQPDV